MPEYLYSFTAFKEKDNLVVLTRKSIFVDTCATDRIQQLSKRLGNQEDLHTILSRGAQEIQLKDLHKIELGSSGALSLWTASAGRDAVRKLSLGDRRSIDQFSSELPERLGAGWAKSSRQESRLKAILACGGSFLFFAAATAFFYFGIKYDIIHLLPSFLALIANTLGLTGILLFGGGFMVLTVVLLIMQLVKPGQVTVLEPTSRASV